MSDELQRKTFAEIVESVESKLIVTFGTDINLNNSESSLVKILGTIYPEIDEVWSKIQKTSSDLDIDQAVGASLDAIGAANGNKRQGSTFSTVTVTITGDQGTVIPTGWVRTEKNTGARFVADNESQTYEIPVGLTVDVPFKAETAGAVIALANTITNGASYGGITSTTNASDAIPGLPVEEDGDYRVRIPADLALIGNASVPAIRAKLLAIDSVVAVNIFDNDTGYTKEGVPPYSFRAFIQSVPDDGTDDEEIQEVLFNSKATRAYGTALDSVEEIYTDPVDQQTYIINFDRTTIQDIYVLVDITSTDSNWNPSTGPDEIKSYISAFGDSLGIDEDVILSYVMASYISSVPGITGHELYIRKGSAPTASPTYQVNIAIGATEKAGFDTPNMIVSVP